MPASISALAAAVTPLSQASPGYPVSNPTDGFTTTYPCDASTFSDASKVSSKKSSYTLNSVGYFFVAT